MKRTGVFVVCLLLAAFTACGQRVVSVPPVADATASEPAADNKSASQGFRFAEDRGGKLLAELLPPRESLPPLERERPAKPRHLPPARHIDKPEISIPVAPVELPRLPVGVSRPLLPRALSDELPLADAASPQRVELPTSALVRLASVNVNEPLAVPVLARPLLDRVSLEDATLAGCREGVLTALPPARINPTPFMPFNVPDPFEHARAARMQKQPEEAHSPPAVAIRRPESKTR